ncbi:TPA: hypothetical protein MIZ71_17465 [Klebsiella pneumoniae]|nr:hypothetical protein [Klebsiella pneumoniae]HBY6014466.1 hypothetical protein [Klebsiella pneumoniae]HBY6074326.1 hypothetical protein [Klebsiella pneumoniae]
MVDRWLHHAHSAKILYAVGIISFVPDSRQKRSLHESRRYRVRLRLFHERYGADRGANQRRNRSLARRVPSRDNDKRIKR